MQRLGCFHVQCVDLKLYRGCSLAGSLLGGPTVKVKAPMPSPPKQSTLSLDVRQLVSHTCTSACYCLFSCQCASVRRIYPRVFQVWQTNRTYFHSVLMLAFTDEVTSKEPEPQLLTEREALFRMATGGTSHLGPCSPCCCHLGLPGGHVQ